MQPVSFKRSPLPALPSIGIAVDPVCDIFKFMMYSLKLCNFIILLDYHVWEKIWYFKNLRKFYMLYEVMNDVKLWMICWEFEIIWVIGSRCFVWIGGWIEMKLCLMYCLCFIINAKIILLLLNSIEIIRIFHLFLEIWEYIILGNVSIENVSFWRFWKICMILMLLLY